MSKPAWTEVPSYLLDDPLVRTLPDYLWRREMELHLLSEGGSAVRALPPPEVMAARLRRPLPGLLEDLHKLCQCLLVFQDRYGDWFIHDIIREGHG